MRRRLAVARSSHSLPRPASRSRRPTTLRVSGHVEATDVRLAPEVGGRIVTFDVKEGDRVEAGHARPAPRHARRPSSPIDRARADSAGRRSAVAPGAGRLARRGRAAGRSAGAGGARRRRRRRRPSSTPPKRISQRFESLLAANAGSRKQRDDALDAAGCRAGARAREREPGASRRAAPWRGLRAGARPQEIDAARARVAVGRRAGRHRSRSR